MNKGKKYIFCKECHRWRYCSKEIYNSRFRFTCSKGHIWIDNSKASSIVATEMERIIPKLQDFFNRDDTFYSNIKKK